MANYSQSAIDCLKSLIEKRLFEDKLRIKTRYEEFNIEKIVSITPKIDFEQFDTVEMYSGKTLIFKYNGTIKIRKKGDDNFFQDDIDFTSDNGLICFNKKSRKFIIKNLGEILFSKGKI